MKYLLFLIIPTIVFTGCSEQTEKTPSGFEFKTIKEGDGVLPKPGQVVIFNLLIKDSKDSVWADTYKRGLPERTIIADSSQIATEDGITQMFRMLSKGDSVSFNMKTKTFFEEFVKNPIPAGLDSEMVVNYYVKVTEVLNRDEFEKFSQELMNKYFEKQKEHAKEQLAKDTVAIDNYLVDKGIQADKLPSGIRFVITKQGSGPLPNPEQKVEVNYDGYLLDGTHFDTNVEALAKQNNLFDSTRAQMGGYGPMEITIDRSSVIPGWHHALKQLNEGAKGTFYIPSSLAYGQQRSGPIAENTILVFDIEMVDIKSN